MVYFFGFLGGLGIVLYGHAIDGLMVCSVLLVKNCRKYWKH